MEEKWISPSAINNSRGWLLTTALLSCIFMFKLYLVNILEHSFKCPFYFIFFQKQTMETLNLRKNQGHKDHSYNTDKGSGSLKRIIVSKNLMKNR